MKEAEKKDFDNRMRRNRRRLANTPPFPPGQTYYMEGNVIDQNNLGGEHLLGMEYATTTQIVRNGGETVLKARERVRYAKGRKGTVVVAAGPYPAPSCGYVDPEMEPAGVRPGDICYIVTKWKRVSKRRRKGGP